MVFLDAIDKFFEPITKKIFASEFGKSIRPLSGDKLFTETDLNNDPSCASLPGNIFHQSWKDQHESHCLNDD
ncbi:MAG: hypothetical protein JZU65_21650 [Chlorobium sp.]|nr:hypothetical protein [Chlorobium sp.]